MKYEWTPASEPPDTDRVVLVWRFGGMTFGTHSRGKWWLNGMPFVMDGVTHWRDVEPPQENATK